MVANLTIYIFNPMKVLCENVFSLVYKNAKHLSKLWGPFPHILIIPVNTYLLTPTISIETV